MNKDEATKEITELTGSYAYVNRNGAITLDGDFTIDELEQIIEILKKVKNE